MVAAPWACLACATPYQQRGFSGGYEDTMLSPGVYLIEVNVNGYTSGATAFAYAHRRASELCPSGYDEISGQHDQGITPVPVYDEASGTWGQRYVKKPSHSIVVRCRESELLAPY